MNTHAPTQGISMSGLHEAFSGSEEILRQMLQLFDVQARERLEQLEANLADGDLDSARVALHSLVNISGAVRAFGMSEQAKGLSLALKSGDGAAAQLWVQALKREGELVLRQARVLLEASADDPLALWGAVPPSV